jgi:reverse gyrase
MLADAQSLRTMLSAEDRKQLDEYMESVRQAETKVEKAKHWLDAPLPKIDADHLNLELSVDEPREYLQIMFELIYLAFRTDSTRVATYQIRRENGVGKSDHLARAVGFNLAQESGRLEEFGDLLPFLE